MPKLEQQGVKVISGDPNSIPNYEMVLSDSEQRACVDKKSLRL